MFADATYATPNPDVIATPLNDEIALLHLGSQHYYSLNETGCFIWQRLEQGQTLGAIRAALEAHYDLTPNQAAQSLTHLLTDLLQERLITLAPP